MVLLVPAKARKLKYTLSSLLHTVGNNPALSFGDFVTLNNTVSLDEQPPVGDGILIFNVRTGKKSTDTLD